MMHPITLWKKTPLWVATPIGFIIFNSILLNPTKDNGYHMVPKPAKDFELSASLETYVVLTLILYLFLLVGVGDALLGRRVGFLMASTQRLLYFPVMITLSTLLLFVTRISII